MVSGDARLVYGAGVSSSDGPMISGVVGGCVAAAAGGSSSSAARVTVLVGAARDR